MSFFSNLMRHVVPTSHHTRGGVHVAHKKHTEDALPVSLPPGARVYLPLRQHIGAPCQATVKVGDQVKIGDLIADGEGLCTPLHASVSGKITKIADIPTTMGLHTPAIEIESDGLMELSENLAPIQVENKEDFLKALRQSGYVGLGGAGFPTYFKLTIPEGKEVDTLVVNGAECEPYITVDYRAFLDRQEDFIYALELISRFLPIKKISIGIEANKPKAIAAIKNRCAKAPTLPETEVVTLRAQYPQGGEKVLIKECTGRSIPIGKLPLDIGCIVMNVSTLAGIGTYFRTGLPLVEKYLTVDGEGVSKPMNVRVPLGMPVKEVLAACEGPNDKTEKILMGGPMMGIALDQIDQPILKYNNAILALSQNDLPKEQSAGPCIRCGSCVSVCPMQLMPTLIKRGTDLGQVAALKKSNVMTCMECGSCAYACPAHIPLVQYMRLGKAMIRKEGTRS